MKRMMFALAALAVVSCGTQRKTASDKSVPADGSASEVVSSLPSGPSDNADAHARLAFGLSLFNAAVSAESSPAGNVVISPYSAGMALSMLAEGAAGNTRAELLSALKNASYAGDVLTGGEGYKLSSANSIWLRDGFQVVPSYRALMEKSYSAQMEQRDFSSPATVKEINRWCSDKTSGRIPEIIDDISSDMMMFIINALYFKAPWKYQFDANSTFKAVFHSPSGVQNTDFMHIKKEFLCGEADGNKFVVLPYKADGWNMAIYLPAEGTDVSGLLSGADASALVETWKGASSRDVALSLPKFKINSTMVMNGLLQTLGVHDAFSGRADFSGMTQAGVCVDEVRQKCFIEVNEEGSEAAAVTSIGVRLTSMRPSERPFVMNVDRPFIFAIFNADTEDVLFAGKIGTIAD